MAIPVRPHQGAPPRQHPGAYAAPAAGPAGYRGQVYSDPPYEQGNNQYEEPSYQAPPQNYQESRRYSHEDPYREPPPQNRQRSPQHAYGAPQPDAYQRPYQEQGQYRNERPYREPAPPRAVQPPPDDYVDPHYDQVPNQYPDQRPVQGGRAYAEPMQPRIQSPPHNGYGAPQRAQIQYAEPRQNPPARPYREPVQRSPQHAYVENVPVPYEEPYQHYDEPPPNQPYTQPASPPVDRDVAPRYNPEPVPRPRPNEPGYRPDPNYSAPENIYGQPSDYYHTGPASAIYHQTPMAPSPRNPEPPPGRQGAPIQTPGPKQRLVGGPPSPDAMAWDNPFPTFPAKNPTSKPGSASGNGSTGHSAQSSESRPEASQYPRPRTAQGHEPPRERYEPRSAVEPGPRSRLPFQDDRPPPKRQADYAEPCPPPPSRGYEEAPPPPVASLPYRPAHGQRSNTMPQEYVEPVMAVAPRGPQGGGAVPFAPRNNYGSARNDPPPRPSTAAGAYSENRGRDHGRSRSIDGMEGANFGNSPPQRRQDDFRPRQQDPYNDQYAPHQQSPNGNPQPYHQAAGRQLHSPLHDDMPNFPLISNERPDMRRAQTPNYDSRGQNYPPGPEPPMNGPQGRGRPTDAGPRPGFAAQAARSRSQPNLRDQAPQIPTDHGFDFGIGGGSQEPPPDMPDPNRDYSGPQNGGDPRGGRNGSWDDRDPDGGRRGPRISPRGGDFGPPSSNVSGPRGQYPSNPNGNPNGKYGPQSRGPQDGRRPDGRSGGRSGGRSDGRPDGRLRVDPNAPRPNPQNGPTSPRGGPGSPASFANRRAPGPSLDPRRPNGTIPSPGSNRPINPDALPAHPAPVRPGLGPNSNSGQPAKPPPVRQYNNAPSAQTPANIETQPAPESEKKKREKPVTLEEIESLKKSIQANPTDFSIQLKMAKKLVEAAVVLSDEGGRADAMTKKKNQEKYVLNAHKFLKKLVDKDNYPDAMFYLADCHGRGLLGLVVDPREAFNLYERAAKLGHPASAYRVAVCRELGREEGGGTGRDPLQAVTWYKKAAALGDTPAMYKMGMIQLKGLLGQPKNEAEAINWLKKAAEKADEENPHALHELALLYESATPTSSVIRDESHAFSLFQQSALLNYKFSQHKLGCAYEYGLLGCPVDPRQSIAWYSKAAKQEEHQSELALSGWYLTGAEGILQQSDTEAYLWARKAAQAGLAKAEYAMGYFTEVGIGAPANLEDAKRWYWRAACEFFPDPAEQ
ncbi:MAG: hypothetical protein MMC33_005698 [Icmadophila ericetorum]|nr:hypothetical protein [Icmadophila ericetorum]